MAFFRFVWRFFLLGTSRKIEKDLRDKYFYKLQSLPMSFFNKNNAAKIAKAALKNKTTLKTEALRSGLISEKKYNEIIVPKKMIYPA